MSTTRTLQSAAPSRGPRTGRGVGQTSTPRPPVPGGRPKRSNGTSHNSIAAFLFVTPNLALFTVFILLPGAVAFGLSFFEWDLSGPPSWVGLENYQRLITDQAMWAAVLRTAYFLLLGVAPTILIGFILAALINVQLPGVGALRVLFFIPMVVSVAVSAVLWTRVYQRDSGLLNGLLRLLGIPAVDWLNNPSTALPALTVMMIWLSLPLVIILYLAALARIPRELYEAASLDGAGPTRTLWQIAWPSVRGTTVLLLILQFVNFLSGTFEVTLIMTGGGPLRSTENLALYIYQVAFEFFDIGYASALTLFQFVLILGVAGIFQLLTRAARRRNS